MRAVAIDPVRVGQRLGAVLFGALYRTQVRGVAHVPATGAVIVVGNHAGLVDGPLAFTVCPRPIRFLVKRSFFDGPAGVILRAVGQIPITQRSADREALATARSHLDAGGVIGIFPEGTRGTGDVATAQQGAAWLALRTGATIVPMALVGTAGRTTSRLPRVGRNLTVAFGEPFKLTDETAVASVRGRQQLAAATEVVRSRLHMHVRASQ